MGERPTPHLVRGAADRRQIERDHQSMLDVLDWASGVVGTMQRDGHPLPPALDYWARRGMLGRRER